MTRTIPLLLPAVLAAAPAQANQSGGHSGLALSALVAASSPLLTPALKSTMTALLEGRSPPGANISVDADSIVCMAGDVAINQYSCALTFGQRKVTLTGRKAHELFATLIEVGIPSDGAAGRLYESLSHLKCAVDPNEIKQNTGGGVMCTFDPGPR